MCMYVNIWKEKILKIVTSNSKLKENLQEVEKQYLMQKCMMKMYIKRRNYSHDLKSMYTLPS